MFYNCKNITEIDLSNFNTSQVSDMKYMFSGCSELISLNLSNFNTLQVNNMSYMFNGCSKITLLDLSNFNTSQVSYMHYMFYGCSELTSLDLSNFNTSKVIDMNSMFRGCSKLTSLDLSNFITSKVIGMNSIFQGCSKLALLDLSNFDTSKVTRMDYMFRSCSELISLVISNFNTSQVTHMNSMLNGCSKITSLNITNFNTSKVKEMQYMFNYCSSLKSLNLSNFNTSNVLYMYYMFSGCSELISLDLSNFNTSIVLYMQNMFSYCLALTSLDLSNFNTTKTYNMSCMFSDCFNLEYINLKNFNENNNLKLLSMFDNTPNNIIICINENNTKIYSEIKLKACYSIDCTNNWKSKQKKLIYKNNSECIENCINNSLYKYEYNGICYDNCTNGFIDINNTYMCKCELDKCLLCSNVSLNKKLCTKCNTNYFPKENDPLNIGEYIDCYNNPEGYYLDNNLYKKCYHTCKKCNITGNNINHNCIECNDNYTFIINKNNHINCYQNCNYYYYFDNEYNYHCTINSTCPRKYSMLNQSTNECIKTNMMDIIENYNNKRNNTEKNEIEYYDNILELIENNFIDNYNTSKIDNGEDEIIKTDKVTFTLTTVENQKKNVNNNITAVNLGDCENLLRNYYNISSNITLYMKKVEVAQEGMKIPKIEYDVYCKLFGDNIIKLNLTACENSKISILIPIELTESLDILNSSSDYYNDICYTTTSQDGTDITLNDRKKDFIDNNKTVCQDDCEFSNYDNKNMKAECSCKVKESYSSIADMKINKAKLFENFIDIKNILNFNFLVCYKNLFDIKGIINNIGSYIILVIILFHIITIIIFSLKQFRSLKGKIKDIVFANSIYQKFADSKEKNESRKINYNREVIETDNYKKNEMKTSNLPAAIDFELAFPETNICQQTKLFNHRKKIKMKKKIKKKILVKKRILFSNKKVKDILIFTDEEINNLSYNLAIRNDKRTFCEFYISLLKTKHNLINSFCNNDYNSKIIKIDLFFIGFAIEYLVNALFYDDDTMHEIYQSKGDFDFLYQLPITIYSYLISMILSNALNFLALSSDAIIDLKQSKSKINILNRAKIVVYKLYVRVILYFIVCFLFSLFFWYYISMFCVIYRNTQIHLLKDTLLSFGISLIFPFFIYLVPGFLRIYSLSDNKNKREYLYNFSKLFLSIC